MIFKNIIENNFLVVTQNKQSILFNKILINIYFSEAISFYPIHFSNFYQ